MHEGSGRFGGDMDRNEVEMDLNTFMAMIQEISELKDKIRDLEDATNVNTWQKVIHLARAVDSWRIFPRIFVVVYIYLMYESGTSSPLIIALDRSTVNGEFGTRKLSTSEVTSRCRNTTLFKNGTWLVDQIGRELANLFFPIPYINPSPIVFACFLSIPAKSATVW